MNTRELRSFLIFVEVAIGEQRTKYLMFALFGALGYLLIFSAYNYIRTESLKADAAQDLKSWLEQYKAQTEQERKERLAKLYTEYA